jgi:hypothetical protein
MIHFHSRAIAEKVNGNVIFWLDLQKYLEESGSNNIVDDNKCIGSAIKVNGAEYVVVSWELNDHGEWSVECRQVEEEQ